MSIPKMGGTKNIITEKQALSAERGEGAWLSRNSLEYVIEISGNSTLALKYGFDATSLNILVTR
jgi:hypothetical protein